MDQHHPGRSFKDAWRNLLMSRPPSSAEEGSCSDTSEHLPERQIDAGGTRERVLPVFQRRHAVINEAGGAAPHRDVAVFHRKAANGILAPLAAPQEHRR